MKITYDVILRLLDLNGKVANENVIGQVSIRDGIVVSITSGLYGSLHPGDTVDNMLRKLPEPYYKIKKSSEIPSV